MVFVDVIVLLAVAATGLLRGRALGVPWIAVPRAGPRDGGRRCRGCGGRGARRGRGRAGGGSRVGTRGAAPGAGARRARRDAGALPAGRPRRCLRHGAGRGAARALAADRRVPGGPGAVGQPVRAPGILETAQVMKGSRAAGRTLAELDLRRRTGATVLSVVRNEQPLPPPDGPTRLEAEDLVVLYGPHEAIDRALALLEPVGR